MRYRPLSALGDYSVGKPFLVNTPDTVAQAVLTRLKLWRGEWFLDTTAGTPYLEDVLDKNDGRTPESAIKQRILGTPGVTQITAFVATYDGDSRLLTVNAAIDTIYGTTSVSTTL